MGEKDFIKPSRTASRETDIFMRNEWKSHNSNNLRNHSGSSNKVIVGKVDYSRGYIPAIVVDLS
jgi:hypothetical protein